MSTGSIRITPVNQDERRLIYSKIVYFLVSNFYSHNTGDMTNAGKFKVAFKIKIKITTKKF